MDVEFSQGLPLDPTDSAFVLGEAPVRAKGGMRLARLVCVLHRRNGEFTHLYRVPSVSIGGRREVELLGVWKGACLREASDRVSAMLAPCDPARKADRPEARLLEAA